MTITYSWTICIFVSLSPIVSAQSCKWFNRNQEVVNRQILHNFNLMPHQGPGPPPLCKTINGGSFHLCSVHSNHGRNLLYNQKILAEDSPGVCLNSNFSIPDVKHLYNISKVESAAIAVQEIANQTIQFYRRYEDKLDFHQPAWERLQELLYYQEQQLSDCIPEGAENQLFIQGISQQFITLQRILEEQNDVCAQRTAHAEIRRNFHLAGQLSSRMRRQNLQRSHF